MDFSAFSALFCSIFRANGLERFCGEPFVAQFFRLTELLTEVNAHTNLTAIRDLPGIISKHYADCLLAEPLFPQGANVLDLGCGGGFPTFPLAITRPDITIIALDSTQKKINFVRQAADALDLRRITPLCARAEDARLRGLYGSFDVVTSRAMARMNILCEMALPFVKVGGKMIAYKGAKGEEELKEAAGALRILGGAQEQDIPMTLILPSSELFDSGESEAKNCPEARILFGQFHINCAFAQENLCLDNLLLPDNCNNSVSNGRPDADGGLRSDASGSGEQQHNSTLRNPNAQKPANAAAADLAFVNPAAVPSDGPAPASGEGCGRVAFPSLAPLMKDQAGAVTTVAKGQTETRHLLTVVKIRKTPPQYPRAYALILKKPL